MASEVMAHPVRIGLAIVCLILGVAGVLLPVLQGWIFFLLAGALLFPRHRFVHSAMAKGEHHFPRLVAWLRRLGLDRHHPD